MMNLRIERVTGNGKTAVSQIITTLRKAIVAGTYEEGAPLRQDELAAAFGLSKIPVREALRQLQAEGLVTFYPNRGAFVSHLSADEAREIFVMRIALETVALREAMKGLKTADFIQADAILRIIDETDEPLAWSQLNEQFHFTLYQAANMPRLLETIRMLQANIARYFVIYRQLGNRQPDSQAEHRAILAACQAGDAQRACDHLANHLQASADELIQYWNKTA